MITKEQLQKEYDIFDNREYNPELKNNYKWFVFIKGLMLENIERDINVTKFFPKQLLIDIEKDRAERSKTGYYRQINW